MSIDPSHLAAIHAGARGALGIRPIHRQLSVSQRTNTPDINLERDVIASMPEAEVILGMGTVELEEEREKKKLNEQLRAKGLKVVPIESAKEQDEFADDRFKVNISTILISALLFLLILAWFDFIQSAFYSWLSPRIELEDISPAVKLWYAIMVTIFILILVYLIYYYSRDYIK